jgi:hypothetical protein
MTVLWEEEDAAFRGRSGSTYHRFSSSNPARGAIPMLHLFSNDPLWPNVLSSAGRQGAGGSRGIARPPSSQTARCGGTSPPLIPLALLRLHCRRCHRRSHSPYSSAVQSSLLSTCLPDSRPPCLPQAACFPLCFCLHVSLPLPLNGLTLRYKFALPPILFPRSLICPTLAPWFFYFCLFPSPSFINI